MISFQDSNLLFHRKVSGYKEDEIKFFYKMHHDKEKLRVLVLLDRVPSKENPHYWKHAFDQAVCLSEKCDITIVSPVKWTISLRSLKENLVRLKELPLYHRMQGNVHIWQPRYLDLSFIPWKYRKHYLQIVAMIASLLFLIIRKRIKFNIIHAHFIYRPGYVGAILGKILRKQVIITAHGSDVHLNLFEEGPLYRKRTLDAMKWCNRIIAVSESLKSAIGEEGFNAKTSVIPCGFSEKEFYPMDKKECRDKLSLKIQEKILLFIGNLVPIKGVDILLNAFKLVREKDNNVILIIIGDGPEKLALERQANNLKLEECIRFLRKIEHNLIPSYINAADIVIQPSRKEGRGLVIMEAFACGRPVVASRVGGIPETIINEKLGILVEQEEPSALAKGIIKVLSSTWDEEYLKNQSGKYNNSQITNKILKVYEEVLKQS